MINNIFKKIIDFVVEKKWLFIVFFLLCAIGSVFLYSKVNVNYDMTSYLEEGSTTRTSIDAMNDSFDSNGSFLVMVEDVTAQEAEAIKDDLASIENVSSVLFDSTDETRYKDGCALYSINLPDGNFTNEAKKAVEDVKVLLADYDIALSGGAVESQFLGDSVKNNLIQIMLWACVIVFIILFINSISWIEPLIFLIVLAVAIIINMGTNAFFPSISFITQSICAIMQLALAMDYSIMFLHRYMSEKDLSPDLPDKDVIKKSFKDSMVPILSSSLTTIAGLLALVFLKFKIGMDIGLVLSKGILISLLTVFFFMPGVLHVFSKLVMKTKHRNLYQLFRSKCPKFEKGLAKYQLKTRVIIPALLSCLIIFGFVFYFQANYVYTLQASNDPDSTVNIDNAKIEEVFGIQNTVAILVPHGDIDTQKEVVEYLEDYEYNGEKVFTSVQGISTIHIYDYYTKEELAESYGIPLMLLDDVYLAIDSESDENTKLQLVTILDYIVSNNYITEYASSIEDMAVAINNLISDEKCTGQMLFDALKAFTGSSMMSISNCEALLTVVRNDSDVTTGEELIAYLYESDYCNNLILDYQKYCTMAEALEKFYTKEEAKVIFTLSDETWNSIYGASLSLSLKIIVQRINKTSLSASELVTYNSYLDVISTKDISLTRSQAMSYNGFNYKVLPGLVFTAVYGLNTTQGLTNYEIQKAIITSSAINSNLKELNEKLKDIYDMLPLLDTELSSSEISEAFEIDETIITSVFSLLDVTSIYGRDLIKTIVNEKIVEKYSSSMSEALASSNDMINYAKSMFESENYDRIVLNMQYDRASDEAMIVTRDLRTNLDEYYSEYYVACEGSAFIDFKDTFATDSLKINIMSLVFILLIIAVSFKSISIPIILTLIIEGAIWLTLTISVFAHTEVYFICYLMVVCIQMGTTIDYGILYTSKYVEERKKYGKIESLEKAFQGSVTTILTSGTILVVAAYVVGKISEVSIISSIGYLLSLGSLISVIFILFALPQVLILFDRLIQKTTLDFKPLLEKDN